MKAGRKRLAGDTAREANTVEVQGLRREARDLKEVVAEQTLELKKKKKSMIGDGDGSIFPPFSTTSLGTLLLGSCAPR